MHFQWYPGHMTKARRMMQENIKLIDLIIELVDARVPLSSRNPDIDELGKNKARLILLNKADLADPGMTKAWESYYKRKGVAAVSMSCGNGKDKKKFLRLIKEAASPMLEKWKRRGLKTRSVRIMILGIPNVGKSTLINFISGTAAARTANTPGHTRGKQWVRLSQGLDLLDTPGVLWPKFEDQVAALRLAATGAIAGDVFDADTVVSELMRVLARTAPDALREKYGIEDAAADPQILLAQAGKRRGCILPGGAIDYARAQTMILNDFRSGKLGRITLDAVPAEEV